MQRPMMQCPALTLMFHDGSSSFLSVSVNPSSAPTLNKETVSAYPCKLLPGTPPLTVLCSRVEPNRRHHRQAHKPAILYEPPALSLLAEETHRLLRHASRALVSTKTTRVSAWTGGVWPNLGPAATPEDDVERRTRKLVRHRLRLPRNRVPRIVKDNVHTPK